MTYIGFDDGFRSKDRFYALDPYGDWAYNMDKAKDSAAHKIYLGYYAYLVASAVYTETSSSGRGLNIKCIKITLGRMPDYLLNFYRAHISADMTAGVAIISNLTNSGEIEQVPEFNIGDPQLTLDQYKNACNCITAFRLCAFAYTYGGEYPELPSLIDHVLAGDDIHDTTNIMEKTGLRITNFLELGDKRFNNEMSEKALTLHPFKIFNPFHREGRDLFVSIKWCRYDTFDPKSRTPIWTPPNKNLKVASYPLNPATATGEGSDNKPRKPTTVNDSAIVLAVQFDRETRKYYYIKPPH